MDFLWQGFYPRKNNSDQEISNVFDISIQVQTIPHELKAIRFGPDSSKGRISPKEVKIPGEITRHSRSYVIILCSGVAKKELKALKVLPFQVFQNVKLSQGLFATYRAISNSYLTS